MNANYVYAEFIGIWERIIKNYLSAKTCVAFTV